MKACMRRSVSPQNFYPWINFFSDCVESFCDPENFCPPGEIMSACMTFHDDQLHVSGPNAL